MENIEICLCDFKNPLHSSNFIRLINHYIQDEMGGGQPHSFEKAKQLIQGMTEHPTAFVVFAKIDQNFAGLIVSFVNFSTFKAQSFLNIHDVIVDKNFRGLGLSKMMMERVIEIAETKKCCKICLEVRDDNEIAKKLYQSMGFNECTPSFMHFWELAIGDTY